LKPKLSRFRYLKLSAVFVSRAAARPACARKPIVRDSIDRIVAGPRRTVDTSRSRRLDDAWITGARSGSVPGPLSAPHDDPQGIDEGGEDHEAHGVEGHEPQQASVASG